MFSLLAKHHSVLGEDADREFASADGKTFSDPIPASITYDAAAETMNTTQLQVVTIPADREDVRFVRVTAKPISRIPMWHRAKGLNPWLMIDEIEIKETLSK